MQTVVPGPPQNLEVVSVFHDSIDLRWDFPANPNGIITQYRVSHIRLLCEKCVTVGALNLCCLFLHTQLHPIMAKCAREISCPLHLIAATCAHTLLPLFITIAAPFWTQESVVMCNRKSIEV